MSFPQNKIGRIRVMTTGKSARQLALEIGIPVRRLQAIENGAHVPSEKERQAIAKALGVESWEVQL